MLLGKQRLSTSQVSLTCPITMCEVFYALREAALKHFPGKSDLSNHYV